MSVEGSDLFRFRQEPGPEEAEGEEQDISVVEVQPESKDIVLVEPVGGAPSFHLQGGLSQPQFLPKPGKKNAQ